MKLIGDGNEIAKVLELDIHITVLSIDPDIVLDLIGHAHHDERTSEQEDDKMESIQIDKTAAELPEFWSQRVVAEANGSLFKVAKGIGSTEWHLHDDQDELFLVTHGELVVELRSGDVRVASGELFVVPRGQEHRPRAGEEVRFLIVGSSITSNAAGGKPAWSNDEVPPDPRSGRDAAAR